MTPIQVFSQFRSGIIPAAVAWKMACERLHENVGWSAVLAHVLKEQPDLHPELHAIFSNAVLDEEGSIPTAFNTMKEWMQNKSPKDMAPALAIWASQTQVDHCTTADLIAQTSLAWRWDLALALMPVDQDNRPAHQTLVHILWMENAAEHQSTAQHVDPSILSSAFPF